MNINSEIMNIDKLSTLLSSLTIGDKCDKKALKESETLIHKMLSHTIIGDSDCNYKLRGVIEDFVSKLSKYYDTRYISFDNAEDIDAFDKKYDVRLVVDNRDYYYISIVILLHLLQTKSDPGVYKSLNKKSLCSLIGRFLVLHYGSFEVNVKCYDEFLKCPIGRIIHNSIKCLSLCDWSFNESVYLRLTVLNLLDVLGDKSVDIVKELLISIGKEVKNECLVFNEHASNIILQSCEKFFHSQSIGKIIEPLDTTWLYAYIYKQRFGYIYCKKISESKTKPIYPFIFRATALCFKNLKDRTIGNSPKVVLFEKGIVRRSSSYKPIESEFLFNYSTMKYE